MAQTIPISQVVTINPGVVGTGGNPLALNGVFVTTASDVPFGQLQQFYSSDAVSEYFGSSSPLAALADNYFLSFDNSTKKPQAIIFTPYASDAVGAWVRGSSLAGMTLDQLKDVTGALSVTIGGQAYNIDSVNLSTATSFTNAAELLTTALNTSDAATVTWDATFNCFRITVTATGAASTISAVTGPGAVALGLATGTVSQGADADTATTAMDRIQALSLNWATFTIVDALENPQDFCAWVNTQNKRYLFVPWDNDPQALVANSTCLGQTCQQMKYEAVLPVWDNISIAAMAMGSIASIDWTRYNGRIDLAFKSQSGLAATVTSLQDAETLLENGYTYYGAYSAAGEGNTFNFLYNSQLPGSDYGFADTYINQIYLNAQLQLAIATLLTSVNSLPYNDDGNALIRLACTDPINEALNNGTIRIGVTLSDNQKAQIISALGFDISTELQTQGYYLYIGEATAQTRGQRQSPPISLYYMDGGSIQQITVASIVVR